MDDLISRQAAIDAILAVTGNSSVRELYEHVQEHGLSEMWSGGVNAAIDIIIAVPSAQPKTEERTAESVQNVPNDDLISRKAAIDKLKREEKIFYSPTGLRYLIGAIRDLPSAQPERTIKRTETHACDCISRQAAIDDIEKNAYRHTYLEQIIDIVSALPSAQQWIPCSERLPEDDDYRPCYGHDDGAVWWINDIGQMGLGWYYTSTKTWAYYDEISSSEKSVGNVVAWMPLPPSFKEE